MAEPNLTSFYQKLRLAQSHLLDQTRLTQFEAHFGYKSRSETFADFFIAFRKLKHYYTIQTYLSILSDPSVKTPNLPDFNSFIAPNVSNEPQFNSFSPQQDAVFAALTNPPPPPPSRLHYLIALYSTLPSLCDYFMFSGTFEKFKGLATDNLQKVALSLFVHPLFLNFIRKAILPVFQSSPATPDIFQKRLIAQLTKYASHCPETVREFLLLVKPEDRGPFLQKSLLTTLSASPQHFFGLQRTPELPEALNTPEFGQRIFDIIMSAKPTARAAPSRLILPGEPFFPYKLMSQLDPQVSQKVDVFKKPTPLSIIVFQMADDRDISPPSLSLSQTVTAYSMGSDLSSKDKRAIGRLLRRAPLLPENPGDLPGDIKTLFKRYLVDPVSNARFPGQWLRLEGVDFGDDFDPQVLTRGGPSPEKMSHSRRSCLNALERLMPRMQRVMDDFFVLLARKWKVKGIDPFIKARVDFHGGISFEEFRATKPYLGVIDDLFSEYLKERVREAVKGGMGIRDLQAIEEYREELNEVFNNWERYDPVLKALDFHEVMWEMGITGLDKLGREENEGRTIAFAYLNPKGAASVLLYLEECLTPVGEIWNERQFPLLKGWISETLDAFLEKVANGLDWTRFEGIRKQHKK